MAVLESDSELVEKLSLGNVKAFEVLYKRFYKELTLFSSQFVNIEEAENIVQETMVWVWLNRADLDSKLSFKSLLYTMVKNKCLNCLAHYKVRRKVFEELIFTSESTLNMYDNHSNSEFIVCYNNILNRMPEKFREAFLLNRSRKLTHQQIAIKLKVSVQTVNYRISNALKFLRKGLSEFIF